MKFEAGVHRVQRVPATETQGRIHTSTAVSCERHTYTCMHTHAFAKHTHTRAEHALTN